MANDMTQLTSRDDFVLWTKDEVLYNTVRFGINFHRPLALRPGGQGEGTVDRSGVSRTILHQSMVATQPKGTKCPEFLCRSVTLTEALDTFYAYDRLPEDGFDVVVAGPEARLYHTVLHEIPPNPDVPWDITQERPGYHLQATVAFCDLVSDDFAGMFISDGRAPEYIRYDADLLRWDW